MHGYGAESYGEHFADVYDDWYGDISNVAATVAGIHRLAAGGPVLELGVGTGRLAIPLAMTGLEVIGVDASEAMLAQLGAKDQQRTVEPLLADMAELPVDNDRFAVVFAAFNTFFNLPDDEAQRRCVTRVHAALHPGGVFAIEGFVPPPEGLTDGGMSVRDITLDRAVLSVSKHDAATQTISGQHVELSSSGVRMRPWLLHYRTPEQLDRLLQTCDFTLEDRWADWDGTPFEPDSESHVSVYRR